ncbi:uncharacterized protein PSANT_05056 [Moesziomyces antarcticus]|uniref:DNA topoisomerase (ATP-hydrolyzing) n=1 Tax=Pseudozyma antarctica TaxID=84753 RepID=A0A5C3FSD3_PSEA2|nr:uncharacterized protein PSANT_05056 [Moesziomyces antarcticus]
MSALQDSDGVLVLARIDALVADLLHQLADQLDAVRPAPLRISSTVAEPGERDADAAQRKARPVMFPTRASSGVRRFAQYVRVLEVVQANLLAGRTMTKREVFNTQRASDLVVERLGQLLGCTRGSLGIVASTRGLVSGSMHLRSPDGRSVHSVRGETQRIPADIGAAWTVHLTCPEDCRGHVVLVVEKACVFQRLLDLQIGSLIVVTACGYADTATLQLVRLLAASPCPGGVRVCGLFDGDPYGVDIHMHYCAATPIEWLGVDADEFDLAPHTHTALRADERTKAMRLLRHPSPVRETHRRRLTSMLLDGYKVQIDAAYNWTGGLGAYLQHKLEL